MEGSVLVLQLLLLCLNGGLLAGAGDASRDGGRARPAAPPLPALQTQSRPILLPGQVQLTWMPRVRRQIDLNKKKKAMRTGAFSTSNITWNPEWLKASPTSSSKRLLEKISAPFKPVHRPGATPIIAHPEHPLPTEWERKLQPAGSKKKPRRKARVGSFSLLSNNPDTPPQVTRVRRQVNTEKKKKRFKHLRRGTPFDGSGSVKGKRASATKDEGIICIMTSERCRCLKMSSPEMQAMLFPQHDSTHISQ